MGRVGAACSLLVASCSIYSCATILGIDDGIQRQDDASANDATVDAAFDAASDVGSDVVDAGIDVPVSPIACGTSTCNALVEACCRVAPPTDASLGSFHCASDAADCTGLMVTCDETANCNALGHTGDVCCAMLPDGGTAATSTSCIPASSCTGAIMCQPGDDEDCNVDAGESCLPSIQTIIGYDICKT